LPPSNSQFAATLSPWASSLDTPMI
jgi:hypothetical protein